MTCEERGAPATRGVVEFQGWPKGPPVLSPSKALSVVACLTIAVGLSACDKPVTTENNTVTLTSIAVTPAAPSIELGASQQFRAVGTYSDGSTRDISDSVTWASSDSSKADVSTVVLATGAAIGTATITASSANVSGAVSLQVTSSNIAPQSSLASSNPGYVDGDASKWAVAGSLNLREPTVTLTWPETQTIGAVKLYVGCNDGESMSGTLTSGELSIATVESAGCGALVEFAPFSASTLSITMTAGGGSDNNISVEEIQVFRE